MAWLSTGDVQFQSLEVCASRAGHPHDKDTAEGGHASEAEMRRKNCEGPIKF